MIQFLPLLLRGEHFYVDEMHLKDTIYVWGVVMRLL